jgi:hypothetical protein
LRYINEEGRDRSFNCYCVSPNRNDGAELGRGFGAQHARSDKPACATSGALAPLAIRGGVSGMIEGWVLAGIILVIGVLVLVGVCNNAVRSCDEKRRYRNSDRAGSLGGR